MSVQSMSFIFGALLLAVAILGGGFEVKEIKVSNVSIGVRFIAGIVWPLLYRSRPSAVRRSRLLAAVRRTD